MKLQKFTAHEQADRSSKNSWKERFCRGCGFVKKASDINHYCPKCKRQFCDRCLSEYPDVTLADCPNCTKKYSNRIGPP